MGSKSGLEYEAIAKDIRDSIAVSRSSLTFRSSQHRCHGRGPASMSMPYSIVQASRHLPDVFMRCSREDWLLKWCTKNGRCHNSA